MLIRTITFLIIFVSSFVKRANSIDLYFPLLSKSHQPCNELQILPYTKAELILISLSSLFGDESEELSLRVSHMSMIRKVEDPARDGKGEGRDEGEER